MQTGELIKQSDELKQEAEQVVKDTKIINILSKIGKIDFVGSYALNLLYRPDIDLFVSTNNCTRESAVATTKELLDSGLFQTVGFADWTKEKQSKLNRMQWLRAEKESIERTLMRSSLVPSLEQSLNDKWMMYD